MRIVPALVLIALIGCNHRPPGPQSVSGKVTVGGKPVTAGTLIFHPDGTKGNDSHTMCVGKLGSQGEFELQLRGATPSEQGRGIPLGWYRVVYMPPKEGTPFKVDANCSSVADTKVSIEIVANPKPDQYEISLPEG